MAKILVTGASGMLGQDLCPILEKNGYEVIKTNSKNMDITNKKNIEDFINNNPTDIVIHCAAYTNVDKAEDEYKSAELVNSIGTKNLAEICSKKDILIVYISTDYVFDGKNTVPYTPESPTAPINNYGLTKLLGEKAVIENCKKYYIARTSWLYGINGKNFVETMLSLANKPELKVVDDQTGCPTWTVDLSNGIITLLKGYEYGIYHLCSSGHTTWYGFAKEIFELSNLKVNLTPCTTQEFKRPAPRPMYSVMENNNICPDWKIGLKKYLKLRQEKNNTL